MTAVDFEIRNIHFEIVDSTPRFWHGGRRSITIFFDNLSIFFPLGEAFFVRSVKAFRDRAEGDPLLQEEVKAFCGQEGVHSREHRRYNEHLEAKGYPVRAMEGRVRRILDRVRRWTPRRWQLATTCALEHFTALMGHVILEDARLLEGASPVMRDLWLWHALEENEHKAVAFDVWVKAGGTYPERVVVMVAASVIFWTKVIEQQVRMMKSVGILGSVSEWAGLLNFLFGSPGGLRQLVGHYLSYYRPGFHPWTLDNRASLQAHIEAFEHAQTFKKVGESGAG